MQTTALIGDLHLRPGDTLNHRFSCALQKYDRIIDLGDQCELQIYGIDAWKTDLGQSTIYSIANSVKEMIVIPRNHWGRRKWAKELYEPYPHVTVMDEYEFTGDDGRTYWFRHGSEYSEWWAIQPIADFVTLSMSRNPRVCSLWYRWCVIWGYLPASIFNEPPHEVEQGSKVNSSGKVRSMLGTMGVKIVWKNALRAAEKRENTVHFIAHTHRYCHIKGKNGSELFNIKPRHIVSLRV